MGWISGFVTCPALTDDTIMLLISRHYMTDKFKFLNKSCDTHGMKIYMDSIKFLLFSWMGTMMVSNSLLLMMWSNPVIFICTLEARSQWMGLFPRQPRSTQKNKLCHVLKCVAFVDKNNHPPFFVKLKVFEDVLMSTLLCRYES